MPTESSPLLQKVTGSGPVADSFKGLVMAHHISVQGLAKNTWPTCSTKQSVPCREASASQAWVTTNRTKSYSTVRVLVAKMGMQCTVPEPASITCLSAPPARQKSNRSHGHPNRQIALRCNGMKLWFATLLFFPVSTRLWQDSSAVTVGSTTAWQLDSSSPVQSIIV